LQVSIIYWHAPKKILMKLPTLTDGSNKLWSSSGLSLVVWIVCFFLRGSSAWNRLATTHRCINARARMPAWQYLLYTPGLLPDGQEISVTI
jgi:hypothetical protein